MSDQSPIEWTEATWNPIAGCSLVSPGCTNCYAMRRVAPRLAMNPTTPHYAGTVQGSKAGPVWTGRIGIASDAVLLKPLRWKRPRMIFVNSTSDLFHPGVPEAVIDRIFAVMALCPQHTFQVLTKRPERMREYLQPCRATPVGMEALGLTMQELAARPKSDVGKGVMLTGDIAHLKVWPLPNVWLGTSVEDQRRANERIPHLLATPAAVRFISAEPLLGPIDLEASWHGETALDAECWGQCAWCEKGNPALHNCQRGLGDWERGRSGLDWVIVGGESGGGARPMHPDWARSLRDQCAAAGVPFFFKQWGEWLHQPERAHFKELEDDRWQRVPSQTEGVRPALMFDIGKKAAGRLLDGVEHNGMPGGR